MLDELENLKNQRDFGFCRRIKSEKFEGAKQKMSRGKVIVSDEITVEFGKKADRADLECLTGLLNFIFRMKKMHEDWQYSFMSHTMKFWERVVVNRVRRSISISENQCGFMSGWSIIESIHLMGRLVE